MASWYFDAKSTAGSPDGSQSNPWTDPAVFESGGAFNSSASSGDTVYIRHIDSAVDFNSTLSDIKVRPWPGQDLIEISVLETAGDLSTVTQGASPNDDTYSVPVGSLTINQILYDWVRPIADDATPGKYEDQYPLHGASDEPGSIFGEELTGGDATVATLQSRAAAGTAAFYQDGTTLRYNLPAGVSNTAAELRPVTEVANVLVQMSNLNGWSFADMVIEGGWDLNRCWGTNNITNCTFEGIRIYLAGRASGGDVDAIALAARGANNCTVKNFIVYGMANSDLGVGAFAADSGSAAIDVDGVVFENFSIHRFDFRNVDGSLLIGAGGASIACHTSAGGNILGLTFRKGSVHGYGSGSKGVMCSLNDSQSTVLTRAETAVKSNHRVIVEDVDFWTGRFSSQNQSDYQGWFEDCYFRFLDAPGSSEAYLRLQNATTQRDGSYRLAFVSCKMHGDIDEGGNAQCLLGFNNSGVFLFRDLEATVKCANNFFAFCGDYDNASGTGATGTIGLTRARVLVVMDSSNNRTVYPFGVFGSNPTSNCSTQDFAAEGFDDGDDASLWIHMIGDGGGSHALTWNYPTAAGWSSGTDTTTQSGFETALSATTRTGTWEASGTSGADITAANFTSVATIDDARPTDFTLIEVPSEIVGVATGIDGNKTGLHWGPFGPAGGNRSRDRGGRLR